MKQGLSLRVSQHLALTPQLQQSIRLLQLSTIEMAQEVEQMLDDNPFLERSTDEVDHEAFGLDQSDAAVSLGDRIGELAATLPEDTPNDVREEELAIESSWEGDGSIDITPDDSEWGSDAPARLTRADEDDGSQASDYVGEHITLQAHLHEQALALRLTPEEGAALFFLIESLDDDGYLSEPLESLAEDLAAQAAAAGKADSTPAGHDSDSWLQRLRMALHWLQHMEPTGVGARSLAECLKLQILELRNTPAAQAALAMCEQPLELLARRDTRRLSALCGCSEEVARAAMGLIARLEPKPGRRFADVERHIIVPDVIVTPQGRGFKVQLNPEVMPRLKVQDVYANAIRGGRGEASHGMQQRLQEARWFIKNIQQRFDTILRVASAIVERQRSFFLHGELAMRPLVLREIADELGLHESTISRVTTAKFMATPFGTYELKFFFGSALGTETGGNASSTAVRALIKQFVGSEDPRKPLSDNQLSDMLKEQGIECARRTVAKYREALKIAPANLRKSL